MLLPRLSLLSYARSDDTHLPADTLQTPRNDPVPCFQMACCKSRTRLTKSNDRLCVARLVELRMVGCVGRVLGVCSWESGRGGSGASGRRCASGFPFFPGPVQSTSRKSLASQLQARRTTRCLIPPVRRDPLLGMAANGVQTNVGKEAKKKNRHISPHT